jgi:ribosomal-protein-alanine N-acetyltransferase
MRSDGRTGRDRQTPGKDHAERDSPWALLSGNIGYWVAEDSNGLGHATKAVTATVWLAFEDLGLHRVQAETLVHNEPSHRVLVKAGFTRYGLAPAYLRIAGAWQDHVMYQRINDSVE